MCDDDFDWEWQKLRLMTILAEVDGDAFESLFQKIAKARWGAHFDSTIPMGSRGDLKCDGFHSGIGCVYQCYGPRYGQVDVNDALKKVNDDFRGAKTHWGNLMTKWAFVVGFYRNKSPSEVVREVAKISAELGVPYEIMHRDEIIDIAQQIEISKRIDLFGRPPGRGDMIRRVTYANIGRALAFIRGDTTESPVSALSLPPDVEEKLAHNFLSGKVRHFLAIGGLGANRVREYIKDRADPDEAARMAEGFSARYRVLRDNGAEPADAFNKLLQFAGGGSGDVERDAAALAIVTHFFTTCEIFERPPEDQAA
ncbi:ABC-three component system protein [Lichenibacterium ramalinae]|uniref:ABC-three component system protein n=1 Tax=Lichenibacterium ramalinae TaxID=2316527 RepID=UPI00100FDC5F|nr:ABC-three component system protein [Lichenibacterium ramalinae]